MSENWSPSSPIEGLQEYLFEANLPQILNGKNQITAEFLLEYYVIDKRRFELDEIKNGMDAVSLTEYLRRDAQIASIGFPRSSEKVVDVNSLKEMMVWEVVPDQFAQQKHFFEVYIDELTHRNEGGGS